MKELALTDLPPNARVLVDACGMELALRLVDKYGGTNLYIPIEIPEEHPLVTLLGVVKANALSRRMDVISKDHPAERAFHVPVCKHALKRIRDRQMYQAYLGGKSAAKLALEHGMDERSIRRILSDVKKNVPDERQGQLKLG